VLFRSLTQFIAAAPAIADWLTNVYSGWQVAVGVLATTLVSGTYYAFARWVESKYPKAGKWLLGSASKPIYVEPNGDIVPDGPGPVE